MVAIYEESRESQWTDHQMVGKEHTSVVQYTFSIYDGYI